MVTLVACRGPIPGVDRLPGNGGPASPSPQTLGTAGGGDQAADNPLPASPTAPWIERMVPDNSGPGVEVTLAGKNLTAAGIQVYFGDEKAESVSPQADGSLKAVVPNRARTGYLAVVRGQERAVRWFKVLTRLDINFLRPLPAPVGVELPLAVTAYDTEGTAIAKPYYTLSVEPSDAADVVTPTSVIPRREGLFKVQAFSGRIQAITTVPWCTANATLSVFAGDGEPLHFVSSNPVLTQGSSDSNGFAEIGRAETAHIGKPWGVVTFRHPKTGVNGILISDTLANRVRFVPMDGSGIKTVVGGGTSPAATDSKQALAVELLEPAGMAIGKDFDEKEVVMIVERGRHQVLRWDPNSDQVQVIAGRGVATTTRNGTDSIVATPEDLGDRNDAKKICGEPTKATFFDPASVALVYLGNKRSAVIVADTNNHRIRKIVRLPQNEALNEAKNRNCTVAAGEVITGEINTILGNGKAGSDINSADPASTSVNAPLAVAAHPDGPAKNFKAVYVADTNNNRILEMTGVLEAAQGVITVRVAAPPAGHPLAPMSHPSGLYLHPVKRVLLIADTLRNRILRYQPAGEDLKDLMNCTLSTDPKNGLVWPRGITSRDASDSGEAFPALVSDYYSNQIRLLDTGNNQ